jgi:endonuclease/exonuclease/phosphatase family metal-dependent hydrolase
MKVITQNLEFLFNEGTHFHSGKEWGYTSAFVDARTKHFADFFKQEDADVIFLQELASEEELERIIKQSTIPYVYFLAAPDKDGVRNAILTKAHQEETRSIPSVSEIPVFITGDADGIGPRLWSRRDHAYVKIMHGNTPYHLVCIHLKSNFGLPERSVDGVARPIQSQMDFADGMIRSELFRASQAKSARKVIDELFEADSEARVIVAGDFNTEPSTPIFKIIQGGIKDLPDYLPLTTKAVKEEDRYTVLLGEEKYLADHILVSKVLKPQIESVTIYNKNLPKERNAHPIPHVIQSDHAPVIVEFRKE